MEFTKELYSKMLELIFSGNVLPKEYKMYIMNTISSDDICTTKLSNGFKIYHKNLLYTICIFAIIKESVVNGHLEFSITISDNTKLVSGTMSFLISYTHEDIFIEEIIISPMFSLEYGNINKESGRINVTIKLNKEVLDV